MTPYFQNERCTIYHGDCAEVLPELGRFDLLLTDPPYGIADQWKGGGGHGWANAKSQSEKRNQWDADVPADELIRSCVNMARHAIVWGGNYFNLPAHRCFLVWNKPERNFTLAEAEVAWTNADNVARVCDCNRSEPDRKHPTQKPLRLMRWCLNQSWVKSAETVLDPFMGSGTTLHAAQLEGRHCVGIEREESYCEIAADRLAQKVLF